MKFSEFLFFCNDRLYLLGETTEEGILFLVILCDIYAC